MLRRWPQDSTAVLGRSPCKPRGVVLALSMEPLVKLLSCARRSCRAPHRVQAKGIGIGIPIVYIYIYMYIPLKTLQIPSIQSDFAFCFCTRLLGLYRDLKKGSLSPDPGSLRLGKEN